MIGLFMLITYEPMITKLITFARAGMTAFDAKRLSLAATSVGHCREVTFLGDHI
jgi:hypothetical protein